MRFTPILTALFVFLSTTDSALAAGAAATGDTAPTGTDGDIILLVAYVSIALSFSFVCSIAEASLLSMTPSYIEGLREKQPKRAALLRRLRQENVDRSLAAILTLNTIAHTAGAIGAGAQATVVFGGAWTGVFSAAMTLAILFLSEIVPKTIGTVHWRRLVDPAAHFIRILIVLLYPLVVVSEWLTKLIARGKNVHAFSRQEFIAMAGFCEESGHIDVNESRILGNLFRFGSLRAADVMTPRTVITALPMDMTIQQAQIDAAQFPFSRLPLFETGIDDIRGFVLKDEVLTYSGGPIGDQRLESLMRSLPAVPSGMTLSKLLDFLLEHRHHVALVVDEYGGTSGLVTLEDVLETLLGMEIVDEMDNVEDMQNLARERAAGRSAAHDAREDS
ncbi:MAG: hemolysin family protein [Coriobacteriia bacterium]|nr:hemolysin family protein [Coriobacteriia bacterium]